MSGRGRAVSDQQRVVLDRAWAAQLRLEEACQRRDELAVEAVRLGASWREIAAVVKMSPEAAQERYRAAGAPSSPR